MSLPRLLKRPQHLKSYCSQSRWTLPLAVLGVELSRPFPLRYPALSQIKVSPVCRVY